MRLDQLIVRLGLAHSRNKAQELIAAGQVLVGEEVAVKSSLEVEESADVQILSTAIYVSRAAEKLKGYLAAHPLEIVGKRCLDIGSSTGGFAQVLLERGAREVVCVDVGSGQLHPSLRDHPRIVLHEQTDIRAFSSAESFALVTCDVSFISLAFILPSIHQLASGTILLLFKPQFEVGLAIKRNKRGVVQDEAAVERARGSLVARARALGWSLEHELLCSTTGKEGNQETFLHFSQRAGARPGDREV